MKTEFTSNMDAFDRIMGDCTGTPMADITEDDIREQARLWGEQGEDVSDTMIWAAVEGLREYQEDEATGGPLVSTDTP